MAIMAMPIALCPIPSSPYSSHQFQLHHRNNMCLFGVVGELYQSTTSTTTAAFQAEPVQKPKEKILINNASNDIDEDLGKLSRQEQLEEPFGTLNFINQTGIQIDSNTYASLLQVCADMKSVAEGKQVHAHLIVNGMVQKTYLGTELMNMYIKCGSLLAARQVFDKMTKRNIFSWTTMIGGYVRHGCCEEAIVLYCQMQEEGLQPDHYIFPKVLKACANLKALQQGKEIHNHIIKNDFQSNIYVENSLVDMYVKCESIDEARKVFDKMSLRDVVSWNMMISGYAQRRQGEEGLKLFRQMQLSGIRPDEVTWNAMIAGYAQSGHGDEALSLFRQMQQSAGVQPNVISWTSIIAGNAQNGYDDEALKFFNQMQLAGVKPNSISIASVLSACAHLEALQHGKEIHAYTIKDGFERDVLVGNGLVDMYAKCGIVEDARRRFDEMSQRDVISWNALIAGYAKDDRGVEAVKLYQKMQLEGIKPDVITWNGMIAGYTQNGHGDNALKLLRQMQLAGTNPDSVTISSVLSACAQLAALRQGQEIHAYVIRSRFEIHAAVGSALVAMYVGCGIVEDACHVFDQMSERDIVVWNAMIAGYAQKGYSNHALKLFRHMQIVGIKPNMVTIVSVLPACARLAALRQGKEIHDYIIRGDFDVDVFMWNALIDMYAKSGSIKDARCVFDKMFQRDVISWNAMIAGYGMHGHGEDALAVFSQMQQAGIEPNHITFTCVLSACSHAGLVDEGWKYFNCMSQDYHITPNVEQYACLVDLLGRAGRLDEAQDFIKKMPLEPNVGLWGAVLGACRIHCNIELGQYAADHLFELEPENAGNYVLLSNIYSAAGQWDNATKVRKMMKDRGLKKPPGYSWIEVNKRVHAFLVGDRSHPQIEEIYTTLDNLAGQIKKAGYVPDTNFVLHNIGEEEKEHVLCGHSEKLAIAFGLINTCPGTPIKIIKNLRVCGDCHTATKFISKITDREIIVRDGNRFHHFMEGLCSCGDYW
eukprot:Gb_31696 [translate_table: standard]